MILIQSKDNQRFRDALKLKSKKYRDERGLYLLEGIKPLADAAAHGVEPAMVFVAEGTAPDFLPEEKLFGLSPSLFGQLSDTETSQGVIAVMRQQPAGDERMVEILERAGRILILDRIQDPGNLGTMIRTAEAAGYDGVILLKGCTDVYAPKVVRAAAGSLLRLPVMVRAGEEDLLAALRSRGIQLIVTALEDARDYREGEYEAPFAVVIGNEGRGVSEGLLQASDVRVHIPMAGAIESLNASVAAGIIMYESQNIKSCEV